MFLLLALLALNRIRITDAHATYMTSSHCSRSISAGTTIMDEQAISDTARQIKIVHEGTSVTLSSGGSYLPGEKYTVSLSSTAGEYVFETSKGSFKNGGCTGNRRYANGAATLTMPAAGSGQVTIIAGWANQHGTVRIVTPFTLNEAVVAPTAKPTAKPTAQPSILQTPSPSREPSLPPTADPTATPTTSSPTVEPTREPTFGALDPTPTPTCVPTTTPTAEPTSAAPSQTPSEKPSAPPSLAPSPVPSTAGPTYEFPPTPYPTSLQQTLVSLSAVQALANVSAGDVNSDPAALHALAGALEQSLLQSMSKFAHPQFINVTSVIAAVTSNGAHLRQLADASPSTQVAYLIGYILEESQFSTASELETTVNLVLNVISDGGLFVETLLGYGVPALSSVSGASVVATSLANVETLRSQAPSAEPAAAPSTDDAYAAPVGAKAGAGVVVGVVGLAALAWIVLWYSSKEEGSLGTLHRALAVLPAVLALTAAVVAVALVAAWATDSGGARDFGFLKVPSWSRNVFAYHPVCMVLFFALQVQALTNWTLFGDKLTAKTAHVLVQLSALGVMVTALVAVTRYMWQGRSPSLVSIHSWVGVAAVAVFGFNFLWGGGMAYLTRCMPDSPLRSRLPLLNSHKFLGLTSVVLAAVAVNTGIMEQLPRGSCNYVLGDGVEYQKDYDPAGKRGPLCYAVCCRLLPLYCAVQKITRTSPPRAASPTAWASR
jgi:hypothetical protein